MIYVLGEPPQWLINVIKELGEDIAKASGCDVPPRSVVISTNSDCVIKGSVVLSIIPRGGAIPIQRSTARGVLSVVINVVKRIENANSIMDALSLLGFTRTEVNEVYGTSEVSIKGQVNPGSMYTITVINTGRGTSLVTLGRGTVRNTLLLDSSVMRLLSSGGEVYVSVGDLVLELTVLFMIFGINLIHLDPPY